MTAEVIEGEAREVEEPRALAVRPDAGMHGAGAMELAALDDAEFDRRLVALEKGRDRVQRIQRALMVKDVDYGVIPGTGSTPTLLKPGAEKLCQAYGLVANFTPQRSTGDGETVPHLSYLTRCDLHLRSLDGPIVANGWGSANSWETKHRYRNQERTCPSCQQPSVIKSKAEYGGGWLCWKKRGGCGATYKDGDPAIEGQPVGKMENPDPFDLDVVLAKMSEKRAYIDATLRATAASGLFTQDVEDVRPTDTPPEPEAPPFDGGGLIGTAVTQGTQDFELRETPDGPALPFRVKDGRKAVIVVAHGPMALSLAAMRDAVIGQRVECWGSFSRESFDKRDDDGKVKKVYYDAFHLTRVKAPEFELPAADAPEEPPVEPVEAATAPLFDDETDAALSAAGV